MFTKIKSLLIMTATLTATMALVTPSHATTLYTPVGGDSRGYDGDNDWASGYWKGECGTWEILKGVSRYYPGQSYPGLIHGLWCYGPTSREVTPASGTLDLTYGDSSHSPTYGSDWDSGFAKAECSNSEAISGIAQNSNGEAMYARCATVGPVYASSCHALFFGSSDNPSSQWGGDWDQYYNKNQCAQNEAVKGYSIDSTTHKIRSIWCCSYTAI